MKRKTVRGAAALLALVFCTGCGELPQAAQKEESSSTAAVTEAAETSFSDRDLDGGYDAAEAVKIALNGDSAEIDGEGAAVSDGVVTVTGAGVYLLSGEFDGMLAVEAGDADKVQLVLSGAALRNSTGPAIWVKNADKVFLTLAEGTENSLSDSAEYIQEDNVDAVVFSKSDLTINGSGSLEVSADYKHGIVSKDDLAITGGTLKVTAAGQALNGKDCVKIRDGSFELTSGGDAIQSDNSEDAAKGSVSIEGGSFLIVSGTDGIQAETALQISGGELQITAGGGSGDAVTKAASPMGGRQTEAAVQEETPSTKGLKAGTSLLISGGSITVDSLDDAVHSNGSLTVTDGTLALASGDDGIHADGAVAISGGTVTVSQSYEGIEGSSVTISGGELDVTASDDGVNAAGGNDGSSLGGRPGQNSFSADSDRFILITGGKLTVDAAGDGLDSNGALTIEGGEVYVNGPTSGGDGALDCDGQATISGGTVVAVGSAAMAQGFSDTSAQCSLLYGFRASLEAGTPLSLSDSTGKTIVSFTPSKAYQSVVISAPELSLNGTYTLSAGEQTAEITLDSQAATGGVTGGRGGSGGGRGGSGKGGDMPDGEPPEGFGELPEGGSPGERGKNRPGMGGDGTETPPEEPAE